MSQSQSARTVQVAVAGGDLTVQVTTGKTEPVLAIHGISSQHRLWSWLAAEAPELSLIAPDLRGRGGSVGVTGGYGMARHVDDMIAVLDQLGLDRVHICGMSMGGFIGVELALRYPDRVTDLVLVDGGLPMSAPPGLTEDMLPAMFADRIGRLGRDWTMADYSSYFVTETAPLLDPGDALLQHYLDYDLDRGADGGRVRLSGDALLADARDIFFGPADWRSLTLPVRMLYAEFSVGDSTAPAYPEAAIAAYQAQLPSLMSARFMPGLDHAGSIMTKAGASLTAETIFESLR